MSEAKKKLSGICTGNPCECADGGEMLEVYKAEDWGQVNLRTVPPNSSKDAHVHRRRTERWWLVRGEVVVTLHKESGPHEFTWKAGSVVLTVPAGTPHAVRNEGREEALIVFFLDEVYDPADPDKEPWP